MAPGGKEFAWAGLRYQYAAAARAQARLVDRNQPVYNLISMDDLMAMETYGV